VEYLSPFDSDSFVFPSFSKHINQNTKTILLVKEEQRLSMFEDTAMRKIFEPRWVEVTGGWKTLHVF
jgi:hypothetical protein